MSIRLVSFGFTSALLLIVGASAFAGEYPVLRLEEPTINANPVDCIESNRGCPTNNYNRRPNNNYHHSLGTSAKNTQTNDIQGYGGPAINVNTPKYRNYHYR